MSTHVRRAVLVVGRDTPSEPILEEVETFDEVFVVERAVADPSERWIVDDARADADARARLTALLGRLEHDGAHARGIVGCDDERAAIADAKAVVSDFDAVFTERGVVEYAHVR